MVYYKSIKWEVKRGSILYYESMKWEFKTRPINECRCDERLKTKDEESTRLTYTGLHGELEHLKIKTRLIDDEVWECDGWVCDCDTIGVSSIFKVIRSAAALARMLPTCAVSCEDTADVQSFFQSTLFSTPFCFVFLFLLTSVLPHIRGFFNKAA
jgi:hypothetical protein